MQVYICQTLNRFIKCQISARSLHEVLKLQIYSFTQSRSQERTTPNIQTNSNSKRLQLIMTMADKDKILKTEFVKLCNKIRTPSDFTREGNETVTKIFQLIQQKSKYEVDRVKIGGSMGKRTAIGDNPDFDIIVFINNVHPYYDEVTDEFHGILTKSNLGIVVKKRSRFCITLTMNNRDIDLLPATNFVNISPKPGGNDLAILQANAAMEFTKKEIMDRMKYSTSLCERTIDFFKGKSGFVHEVIRVAKHWNKTIHFKNAIYITGRSMMIELIAVAAATPLDKQKTTNVFEGFKAFLMLVQEFDKLNITFDPYYYKKSQIPAELRNVRPLILDPVNYYNNFAPAPSVVDKFKACASETLSRLDKSADLDVIFRNQHCQL